MTGGKIGMRPRSLAGKALWVLRHRPVAFVRSARGFSLFLLTRCLQPLVWGQGSGIRLGRNVRVQRLRTLNAERPAGKIAIGDHSVVYENAELGSYGGEGIEIGPCSVLGDIRIHSRFGVRIGRRFLSSWNVFITDFEAHPSDPESRGKQVEAICGGFRPRFDDCPYPEHFPWDFAGKAVRIGNDVWIGANCIILKGSVIGDGCIVASGSVVLGGEYPPLSLIAGNPAQVVKSLS